MLTGGDSGHSEETNRSGEVRIECNGKSDGNNDITEQFLKVRTSKDLVDITEDCSEKSDQVIGICDNDLSSCCLNNSNYLNKKNVSNVTNFTATSKSSENLDQCCRICHCDVTNEKLISPCACSGSVKWMHERCLVYWMKSSFKDTCELCTKRIQIIKRRKPLSQWKLPSQRPTPVLWVLVFICAIILNLASVVKDASRSCSTTPCLVFYAVGCVGVVLGTLFVVYWSKRARIFMSHWLEENEEWVVVIDKPENEIY